MNHSFNELHFYTGHRIHSKKTNWPEVRKDLLSQVDNCKLIIDNTIIDTQSKYSTFMNIIEKAVRDHTPRPKHRVQPRDSQHQFKIKFSPWWDCKCERLVRRRKAAVLKFKFLSTTENFHLYK